MPKSANVPRNLKEQAIASLLGSDGLAQKSFGLEYRTQQLAMAEFVEQALGHSQALLAEAATGVGKSLAYLLPAALWAVKENKKVFVATYTKALQSQLVEKDLPLVEQILKKLGLSFRYSILMGSENYLCAQRLWRAQVQGATLFEEGYSHALSDLLQWAETAETGLRAKIPCEIPHALWDKIKRDPDICLGTKGPARDQCLYRKDIAKAREAHLVVLNQHLFFAGVPLNPYDALIIDEAHNLEDVASRFLGLTITNRQVRRILDDLYQKPSGRGLAVRVRHPGTSWLSKLESLVGEAHVLTTSFFEQVCGILGLAPWEESRSKRVRGRLAVSPELPQALAQVGKHFAQAADMSESAEEESEVRAMASRCLTASRSIEEFLAGDSPDHVYWIETALPHRTPLVMLCKAPLDVSEALKARLFGTEVPVIFTSATLAVEGSFQMVKSRWGAEEVQETLVDSPFDYRRNVLLYMDPSLPDPKIESEVYERCVLSRCQEIIERVTGGIFILFTSWQFLERAYEILKDKTDRPLFKQGEALPYELLGQFKSQGRGILLGTDTFWQGVDVPGTALSAVIITRLPFESPSSPLEEARCEWLAAKGFDVFQDYSLPKAVLKLRQGFGRLIRSKTDRGVVAILDPRILTRRYGSAFLRSLPPCQKTHSLQAIKDFYQKVGTI